MSDVEMSILTKLQGYVTFVPGSSHKRFILGLRVTSHLSARGRNYLAYIAHRYRKQWQASAIELEWIDRWRVYGRKAMTEHYTRNTLTATAWCLKCKRSTEHRVDGGRLGPCLDPGHPVHGERSGRAMPSIPRAVIPPLEIPNDPEQKNLFGEDE
jgi:hypothetical protein